MNKMGESAENYLETILILLERKGKESVAIKFNVQSVLL